LVLLGRQLLLCAVLCVPWLGWAIWALVEHLYICHAQFIRTRNFISGEAMTLKKEFSFSVGKIIGTISL